MALIRISRAEAARQTEASSASTLLLTPEGSKGPHHYVLGFRGVDI